MTLASSKHSLMRIVLVVTYNALALFNLCLAGCTHGDGNNSFARIRVMSIPRGREGVLRHAQHLHDIGRALFV